MTEPRMTATEARQIARVLSDHAATAGVIRAMAEDVLDLLVAEGANRIRVALARDELHRLDREHVEALSEEEAAWEVVVELEQLDFQDQLDQLISDRYAD